MIVGLLAMLAPTLQGAEQGKATSSGKISGQVCNQGTGIYLEGARVVLVPSGRTTITSRAGQR